MKRFIEFISKYSTQKDVIERLYIKAIIDSFPRIKIIPNIRNLSEPRIRNKLVYDLENKNELLQYWIDENIINLSTEGQIIKQKTIFKTEIVFFVSRFGSFVIECKKLVSAEQKYIRDGIRRFTDLEYALTDEFAGMIGFVVNGNILTIMRKLAEKVKNFNFNGTREYLLSYKCTKWNTSFQSQHIRRNASTIHIYHLFFTLC